ncbi:putative ribonuclease H-like domain-containing protein [Tanacetum coccineum]
MERELGEGYSFIKKKCFVCGSLSHLIKDCDFYEKKTAREAELKKQRVFNTGNGVAKQGNGKFWIIHLRTWRIEMPDENQILLKVPRQHNMYSFDMKTPSLTKDYACLIAKATSDESKLWHRRFSWVFFLATKDETSGILQNFIRQIENQLNHRVKIIRSDNGTEFKNRDYA